MASVKQRISEISQPRGGYLNPKQFSITEKNDKLEIGEENIHTSIVGMAVDYLTRFNNGTSGEKAFEISLLGAGLIDHYSTAEKLIKNVKGLDDDSIISACKLSGFDVCYRAGLTGYKPVEEINPDKNTIENIRIMVNRSLTFIKEYGPIIEDGFTFPGGYTNTVNAGDGDFLTSDTLWDFKVLKKDPTNKHTLQLLMYYIMGMHSVNRNFENILYLGIFNPRLNKVYRCEIEKIDKSIISQIEKEVICYD